MLKKFAILLLAFAISIPALPQTTQDSGQQSSTSADKSKDKGKKKSGDESKGATAKCKDGTYSYAKHHQGACSHHGGVAEWYK